VGSVVNTRDGYVLLKVNVYGGTLEEAVKAIEDWPGTFLTRDGECEVLAASVVSREEVTVFSRGVYKGKFVTHLPVTPEMFADKLFMADYRGHLEEVSGNYVQVAENFGDRSVMRVLWDTKEAAVAYLGYDPESRS
jgi:hypothetical protein